MMVVAESGCRLAGRRSRLRGEASKAQASRRKQDRQVGDVMPTVEKDEDGGRQWKAVEMDVR